jgi:hypothetical protein
MRQSYSRSLEYLETETPQSNEEKIKDQFRHQLLLVSGFNEDEIDTKTLNEISDEDFQTMVKQRLLGEMINNGATQKVVDLKEVEEYVASGWEYVASLPNGKAILKLP